MLRPLYRMSWRMALALLTVSTVLSGLVPAPASAAVTDHGQLAFSATDPATGLGQIFWSPGPGSRVQLTSNPNHEAKEPSLAPDGSFVAFAMSTTSPQVGDENIFVVNTTTLVVTPVTLQTGQELYPSVSPSGAEVAYWASGGRIQVVGLGGGAAVTVNSGDPQAGTPTWGPGWSHDGRKLVYPTTVSGASSAVTIAGRDASGMFTSHAVVARSTSANAFGRCAFTPDDHWVVCTRTTDWQLVAIEIATGTQLQLTSPSEGTFDGATIAADWTMYADISVPLPDGQFTSQIRKVWLGEPAKSLPVSGPVAGDGYPAVGLGGPAQPAPANFGGTVTPPPPAPTPTPTPTAAPPPPPVACPTVEIIGARGSRGSAADTSRSDAVLDAYAARVKEVVPGAHFSPIDYPAIPVGFGGVNEYGQRYVDSKFAGVDALDAALESFIKACPNTPVITTGYSQGADVVATAISNMPSTTASHVAAVSLFGDPGFNPRQPAVDQGTYSPKLAGILGKVSPILLHDIPETMVPKVRSYCIAKDPVCGFKVADAVKCRTKSATCAHFRYVAGGWVMRAANSAVSRTRG